MSRIEQALRRASQAGPEDDPQTSGAVACVPEPECPSPAPMVREFIRQDEPVPAAASVRRFDAPQLEPEAGPARSLDALDVETSEKLVTSGLVAQVAVEQYRKLAATLHQAQAVRNIKIVMVASAMAGEGKTLTAVNLALTLSDSFRRNVLLIDADLRRPTVHKVFQIGNATGLIDGLRSEEEQKLSLVKVTPYLSVLPSGRPDSDPMSGLASERMKQILDDASGRFDWVVIDTPPVVLLSDAKLLAEMADAVVLVIRAGITPVALIQKAVESLDRRRIVGVVLNRVAEMNMAYQYSDYYSAHTVTAE
jgi:capsular exopolysaccharide synthesis family protein